MLKEEEKKQLTKRERDREKGRCWIKINKQIHDIKMIQLPSLNRNLTKLQNTSYLDY
jgi:hypothetical protein